MSNIYFERHYNSLSSGKSSYIGIAWQHTFSRFIEDPTPLGLWVRITRDNGKEYVFDKVNGVWKAYGFSNFSLNEILDANQNRIGWRFVDADNTTETYNAAGVLQSITDLTGHTQTLSYDSQGRLERVDSSTGEFLLFSYNPQNRISSVTDHTGRVWTYRYDGVGNLQFVDNPDSTTKQSHYEDSRFPHALTGITDERGVRYATYAYDAQGRAILSTHANDAQRVDIAYNNDGTRAVTNSRGQVSTYSTAVQLGVALVTDVTGPGCSTCGSGDTAYDYDPATNNLRAKTEHGVRTEYGNYDAKGQYGYRIEAAGTADARRVDYQYDARFYHKITSITEPSVYAGGNKVTTYTYDDWGNRLSETVSGFTPDGTPVSRTTTYQYNGPLHQLSQIDGPRSEVADITRFEYYPNDPGQGANRARLRRVVDANGVALRDDIQYTPTGQVLRETRPNGLQLDYSYYPGNDRLETLTETDLNSGATRTTRWTYLPTGEVETLTQGDGTPAATTLTFGYDAARRLTRITDGLGNTLEYQLDTEGNRTAERILDSSGTLKKQLTQTFDLYNRLSGTAQANETTTPAFAADGTLDQSTDGRGSVTDYAYDALKRLTQVSQDHTGSDPSTAGARIGYGYDVADRLTQVTDPIQGQTTYVYDDLGNRLSQTSPDTGTTRFSYDAAGNLTSKTDAKGQVFTYHYDALNRLTLNDGPGSLDHQYGYDSCGAGRLCSETAPGSTLTYRYNAFGDVVGQDQTSRHGTGNPTASAILAWSYDAAGRPQTLTYPSGAQLTYRYNPAGQVQQLDLTAPGLAPQTLLSQGRYAPFGPLQQVNFGNGLSRSTDFDQAYRPGGHVDGPYQQLINPSSGYDANGNLLTYTGSDPGSYGYDALNRLIEATQAQLHTYAYDRNGNRTQHSQAGSSTASAYQPQSNRLAQHAGQPVTLDANGNTTALHGLSFNYNPHNRLVGVPNTAQYRYNARGERISKLQINPNTANNGRRTLFVYAHTELLAETGPTGAVKREYIYLNSQPVAVLDRVPSSDELFLRADFDRDGTISWEDFYEWYYLHYLGTPDPAYDVTGDGVTDSADLNALVNCVQRCTASQYETRLYYVHNDHLGTPKALTDSTGATVWSARHDPFGMATVDSASTIQMPLRFPGQYFDGETGLHYNYFRTYDPATGRYLESDPIGLDGGLNTYGYVGGNPLRNIDPFGLSTGALPWIEPIVTRPIPGTLDPIIHMEKTGNPAKDRLDPDIRRQMEYERTKNFCDSMPPTGPNNCSTLSKRIDHAQTCINLYKSWDLNWLPGRHTAKILDWERRLKNLKEEHNKKCTQACLQ